MKETFHLQETLDESTISMDMMPEDEEMEDNDNKEESWSSLVLYCSRSKFTTSFNKSQRECISATVEQAASN